MNALSVYRDLKARGVVLEAQGDRLKVDSPVGVLTDGHRTALKEHKPKLLELLSRPRGKPQGASEHESVARWAGPGLIKIRDPFTGEWHRWPADECLPGVVAEAHRLRNGTSLGDSRNRASPR